MYRSMKKRLAKFMTIGAVAVAAPLVASSSASALPGGYSCTVQSAYWYSCSHNGVSNTVPHSGGGTFSGSNFKWVSLTINSSGARSFDLYEKVGGNWVLVKYFVFCNGGTTYCS
jgi:hypothetical protein